MDRRKRIDEFGVTLRPEEFVRLEEEPGPIVVSNKRISGGKRKWGDLEREIVEEVPARLVQTVVDVDVNIRMGYVDLEGLHDGRAASTLLPRLNARKLVLLPGLFYGLW